MVSALPTDKARAAYDFDYTGKPMPPPDAVAGTYKTPDGRAIKVAPLTDEDRFTIVRWIDLGCPIDFDYDPASPESRGEGWMVDDNRPILTVTEPRAGNNARLERLLIGAHDYYTGLVLEGFEVKADFPIDGIPAGENLASKLAQKSQGVWELKFKSPIAKLEQGTLEVSIRDRQGNLSRIGRRFAVGE